MINSMMTICGHMTDRILCNEKGSPLTLPGLYPSLYQFRLRFVDRGSDGKTFLTYPNVTSLLASIGLVYAEPRSGTFKLRYGSTGSPTPTEAIDFRENPDDFRTKLAALTDSTTYGLAEVYQPTPSTWMCRFTAPGGPDPIPLNGIENELEPETFIRVRQFVQNADTWVEVRLMQGPIASTSAHDTVLPQPPSVRTIRDGYTEGDALGLETIVIDEIQAITVPPDFTGTYIIKFQERQTIPLSASSGAQNIQDALNALWDDGQTRFAVTNPELNNAYVEFLGPFAGMNMDELQIVISSPGPSDVTFNLNLYTTEVAEALRRNASVETVFEVQLHITDPAVEDDPGQDLILFQAKVTVLRPLHWEGLEEAAPIDWLLPPNPKDYVPFDVSQIIVGDLTYSASFGDGTLSSYVISHHLNSDALSVEIRENASGGRKLNDDEYEVIFDDADALTVTILAGPPAVNSLLITIFASGPVSAFLNHTHTIGQIIGLQEVIDGILARLSALEALLPSVIGLIPGRSPFGTDPSADIMSCKVDPIRWNIVPTNRPPKAEKFDPKTDELPPAGLLLPAVHDVIELGTFTATPGTDLITLAVAPTPAIEAGQRIRINTPQFAVVGACTFDSTTNIITCTAHGLIAGRRVRFSGATLPEGISQYTTYYVINPTTDTFQIALTAGGAVVPLLTNGDANLHEVSTIPDLPGGLSDGVDYFALTPTSTTFKLSKTIGGAIIDITSAGIGTFTMSTIEDLNIVPPA
jgi:hypothetical protein